MMPATAGVAPGGFVLALAALSTFVLAEVWRRWALRRGVLDVPGHRSSHAVATPRGGGIGIVLVVLGALSALLPPGEFRVAAMLGIGLAGGIGLLDDLRPLPAAWKLAGQVMAAVPVALAMPLQDGLLPWGLPGWLASGLALGLLLLFVNAWNFMDGIDGIATLAAVAVCGALWASGFAAGGPTSVLAPILLAACLGFLPLNFPKARVFMGDCGSHALGMGLAILVLAAPTAMGSWVALAASSAFLVDVLGTLVRRASEGERLAQAHRGHLYQLVTRCGYSHARVTTAYAAWMLASGGAVAMTDAWAGVGGTATALVFATTVLSWWWLGRRFGKALHQGKPG